MDIFYCKHCKTYRNFDDFCKCEDCEDICRNFNTKSNHGCCAYCGKEQLVNPSEVYESAECSDCGKTFPKDEGTEYNHRKTGIDEVDCDVRCEDCEGAREIRESDEKSFRQSCWTRR